MSTPIPCAGGCSSKLYCPDDKNTGAYATEQSWTYRFNPFAEKDKKDEYRCKSCSAEFAKQQQSRFGFSTRPQAAPTAAAASKPASKPAAKPEPKPRGFQTGLNEAGIGKIYRERFT